ncbi:SpoIIE family protein phosphatase [Candidatus Parabeggiatoa sp. HSG14]|uniref:PP2C family protein-serine/threonine phosphatase n=1 Tax=Candidatus Parabeggiatoa sp. HSG14 TaxID=3055593 RepID=UPI0025A7C517|nr:SpoIIE family protein phosphatase [Thiotrichales bacterium HSG14]
MTTPERKEPHPNDYEDDEEFCFEDEEESDEKNSEEYPKNTWKVLIVDDEIEVHRITQRVLRNFEFEDKGLTLLSAYSAKESAEILQSHPDIAMILLDVVMEEKEAGLKFVELVRNEFKNNLVRIVLRTGQPGQAPEKEVIVKYDINDYQQKSELTSQRLFTVMVSTLRSFRDLTVKLHLETENMRLNTELNITRKLQKMVLPTEKELHDINELDISGFMEPAEEVAGDYYDVLKDNEHIKIGIGDVTGHGLESGILMLMVQTAVRTLLACQVDEPEKFLNILNRTIYDNVQRMNLDKNLTLSLLDYQEGNLHLTGQHEEVLVVRQGGKVERINTIDLGFIVGLKADIAPFVSHTNIQLKTGDGIVLYTDGITEAHNPKMELYGVECLCEVVSQNWRLTAKEIQQAIVADVKQFIGTQKVYDDITLLVLKQK